MHIAFFIKLILFKNVIYMACYDSAVPLKQIGHLLLGKPHGLILQTDFKPYGGIRLVKYDLIFLRSRRKRYSSRLVHFTAMNLEGYVLRSIMIAIMTQRILYLSY